MQSSSNPAPQRGLRLFTKLLFDDADIATVVKPEHNGRDPQLIEARNNFLLHRAYYKTKIQRKNYPDTFAELSAEVFLSKTQIQKIIQSKGEELLAIKKIQPMLSDLKKQWPHINW